MLIIYLALDGNNKDQVKYMQKKATTWATYIRVQGVQQNEAWKALNSTIPQIMEYSLSDMLLKQKECKNTMQTILEFGLTKAGVSITFHTGVSYGSVLLEAS